MKSETTEAFVWTQEPWGRALRDRQLAKIANHFFTTRELAPGPLGPNPEPTAGWIGIAESIGVGCARLVMTRQVHGAAVHDADRTLNGADGFPDADAIISGDPSRAVSVRVADCVPLLMADPRTGLVAAAHAGWRGTAAGIAGATVRALAARGASPADLIVAIGPSIGPCCYEVGEGLIDAFAEAGHSPDSLDRWFQRSDGRFVLDLWTANADQLVTAGATRARVHTARLCTACRLDLFYSFRKEGARAGRLAAVIRPAPAVPLRPSRGSPAGPPRD